MNEPKPYQWEAIRTLKSKGVVAKVRDLARLLENELGVKVGMTDAANIAVSEAIASRLARASGPQGCRAQSEPPQATEPVLDDRRATEGL